MKKLFALITLLPAVSVCFGYDDVEYVKAWMKLFIPIVVPAVLFICGTIVAIFVTKSVLRSRTRIKEAKYEMLKKFAENGQPMPIEVIREIQPEIPYEMFQGQKFQSRQPQSGQPQSGQPQSGQPQSGQPQSGQPQSGQPQSGQQQQFYRPTFNQDQHSPSHARPLIVLGIAMFVIGILIMINSRSIFVIFTGFVFTFFSVFMLLQIYGYLPWFQKGINERYSNQYYGQCNPPYGEPIRNNQQNGGQPASSESTNNQSPNKQNDHHGDQQQQNSPDNNYNQ